MERRNFLKNIGVFTALSSIPAYASAAVNDQAPKQIHGKVAGHGTGLKGVAVTDGYQIILTDHKGTYSFTPHDNAEFVYITVPSGYAIPNEDGIARFYQKINKAEAGQTVDFNLGKLPHADDKHAFILWGDTQIFDKDDARKLIGQSAPDTRGVINSLGNIPVHGIGCGDLVFDHLDLFTDYKKAVAITNIPFFQLIGNHDMDLQARTDDLSQQSFKEHFGPTYFSFNRGKIHYVILDNVFYLGADAGYTAYLTENQLSWLEKDLQQVVKGSTVVVSLHIPTNEAEKGKRRTGVKTGMTNRAALYKLLEPYKVHILSGHTHYNENWEEGNMMEHNHGTVCGAWWCGPVCGDGTPSGYGVYEVNGSDIRWYYKSVGMKRDHQMKVYKKGEFTAMPEAVMVNVYNWDSQWKVEWAEDGISKGSMEQVKGFDPLANQLYKGRQLPSKHPWVEPVETDHLFVAVPSSQTKNLTIQVTDRFGVVCKQEVNL